MKTYFIKTFGCQMNEHDSQKMSALLRRKGYAESDDSERADVVVINTCSVREKSYQKAVSRIGRIGQVGPVRRPIVAVTGCVVSHDADNILKRFPSVDVVLGPDHIGSLPEAIEKARQENKKISQIDFADISDYEFPSWIQTGEKQVKAYVTVMKGCDNVCAFCIVPFTRGKEVSRPADEIVDEIRRLEEQGIREVMLLGQNVNSYGKGLPGRMNFPKLLRKIDEETTIPRLRFTSPHPKDLSPGLIEEYVRNGKLCPHMHLPVQSGSDRVLRRMRRSYTRATYLKRVEALRKAVPEVAITTDLIVGFPGETEVDFEDTLSLMSEIHYDMSYSFSYSPRPRTEAFSMTDDIPSEVKRERLACLQALQAELALVKNKAEIGKTLAVLVEGPSLNAGSQMMGRSPQARIVNFDGGPELAGAILNVEIKEASAYSLKGVLQCSLK